jgi:hypothetical protein
MKCYRNSDTAFFFSIPWTKRGLGWASGGWCSGQDQDVTVRLPRARGVSVSQIWRRGAAPLCGAVRPAPRLAASRRVEVQRGRGGPKLYRPALACPRDPACGATPDGGQPDTGVRGAAPPRPPFLCGAESGRAARAPGRPWGAMTRCGSARWDGPTGGFFKSSFNIFNNNCSEIFFWHDQIT